MRYRDLLSLSTLALLAAACASGGARNAQVAAAESSAVATTASPSTPAAQPTDASTSPRSSTSARRRSANLITADELNEATHGNVYDLIAATRPEWLRTSGATSIRGGGGVVAYLDMTRLGSATSLRQIPLNQAKALRYYSPAEAQSRFGLDNTAGAIQVETGNR